jgi:type II secretory pathway predicted ATPase ExeA
MNHYSNLNLKNNPFEDITPLLDQDNSAQLIWAGMSSLKQKLENIHRKTLTADPRQIILNWGTVGAGKTYAAFYFSNQTRLNLLVPQFKGNIFYVYVRTPKEGNTATHQLLKDILDALTLSSIKSQVQLMIEETGKEKLLKFLSQRIRSEEFAKAILLLGDENQEIAEMMSRYLYGVATNTELKKMGLARPLISPIDFAKILAGILLCFVGIQDKQKGKLFLWLDELEDLMFFTAKQYVPFSHFLRDLFDQMNEGCTVFMNFTLAEPEQDTVELLLGKALWSRINQKIRFYELSIEDGMLYCKELLQQCQIEANEYSPFTEKSLRSLLEMIPAAEMTPREINKVCNEVLNFAINQKVSTLSEEVIQQWVSQKSNQE